MEIDELRNLCDKQDEMNLDSMVLKMPAPKSWGKGTYPGERVRTPFGLCRWNGGYHDDSIVIFPTVAQVRKYIAKAEKEPFYRIVLDHEKMTATVYKLKLPDEKTFDPVRYVLIGQRFKTEEEATRCLLWAAKEQLEKPNNG